MAFEAPLHPQRCRAPCHRHLVDAAVALAARHPLGDVDAVIEIDEVGQRMDAVPGDRQAGRDAVPQGLEQCGLGEELRMAGQADRCRRQAGECARLHRGMAVAAVEPDIADVVLVAERDRLRHRRVLPTAVTTEADEPQQDCRSEQEQPRQPQLDCQLGSALEDLRHRSSCRAGERLVSRPRATAHQATTAIQCLASVVHKYHKVIYI